MSLIRMLALCFACAFAAQATGVLEQFAGPSCCSDEGCPDDNDKGVCPPSCATCVGKISTARIPAPLLLKPLELVSLEQAITVVDRAAPDGVRDDVFHPPRA